tara:strand:- start:93 stop:269 length:177 start_codon:yes stop_codon:yes gene_type:complete
MEIDMNHDVTNFTTNDLITTFNHLNNHKAGFRKLVTDEIVRRIKDDTFKIIWLAGDKD